MRVKTALLVAAFTGGGLLAMWSGIAEAQGRGGAQPRPPQGGGQAPPGAGRGGQPGPGPGYPGGAGGPARPGGSVYGRPGGPRHPGYGAGVRYGSYYRPSYLYSPWGWYPWYPGGLYAGYGGYGWYGGFGWYGGYYGPYYYGGYRGSSLKIEVQPKDADVFVDGYHAGRVDDFDGFWQSLAVEPGPREVTLFKDGFRTVTQKLYLQPGSTFRLKYQMEPLAAGEQAEPPPAPSQMPLPEAYQPPPASGPGQPRDPGPGLPAPPAPRVQAEARYGQLAVRVQPEGAQIFVDGEAWQTPGVTSRLTIHLPAGTHRLEVRKEGYEPFVAEFEIRPGETTAINVSLVGIVFGGEK